MLPGGGGKVEIRGVVSSVATTVAGSEWVVGDRDSKEVGVRIGSGVRVGARFGVGRAAI